MEDLNTRLAALLTTVTEACSKNEGHAVLWSKFEFDAAGWHVNATAKKGKGRPKSYSATGATPEAAAQEFIQYFQWCIEKGV